MSNALDIYRASLTKLYQNPSILKDEYEKATIAADEAKAIVEAVQDRLCRHRLQKCCANTATT
jgi:hypothetical protein